MKILFNTSEPSKTPPLPLRGPHHLFTNWESPVSIKVQNNECCLISEIKSSSFDSRLNFLSPSPHQRLRNIVPAKVFTFSFFLFQLQILTVEFDDYLLRVLHPLLNRSRSIMSHIRPSSSASSWTAPSSWISFDLPSTSFIKFSDSNDFTFNDILIINDSSPDFQVG